MTEPANDKPQAAVPVSNGPVVMRIILAILLAILGIAGLALFGFALGLWISEGFQFPPSEAGWMPLFIIPAEILVWFSVLTLGIVLRFARWQRAAMASLCLSILSAATIVLGYQLMLDSLSPSDTDSREIALILSVIGLVVISVPPLLHWWNAKRKA